MAATSVDLLISARWIIPIIPEGKVFEGCSVAVDQGQIVAILPAGEASRKFIAREFIELPNHALMPGLINTHGHAAMTLFRGFADDLPLHTWLEKHIWPAEQRWVNDEFVQAGTELAIAEMIRSGTSCFSDMYFFPNQAARAAINAGIRSQITFPIFDFPSAWGRGSDDYIHKGLQLRDEYKDRELTQIAFGPHAPYTLSNGSLEKVATYAEELDCNIQIHLHETAKEITDSLKEHGVRPIQRLVDLGLMSPLTQCVHMTQINDDDLDTLVEYNTHVIHCPKSNLKLASGFCPVTQLLARDINVALGTDGAASNNSLDMFSELSTAALVAKAVSTDASAINAHTALKMATINGAKALGLEHKTGSIEIGKCADLTAIDLGTIESEPLYNPTSQLVYTNAGNRVSHLWVNGNALMKNRQLQTLNENEVLTKARQWQRKIASSL